MNFFRKYYFPPLFGLVIYTSIRLVNDTRDGDLFWKRPLLTNAVEITVLIIAGYLFDRFLRYYTTKFNRQHSQFSALRATREFGEVFIASLALLNAIFIPLLVFTDNGMQLNDFVIVNIIPSLYIMLYYAIVRGNGYIKAYAEQQVQLEKIRNDQLQTELKYLKAQYHPHFLFNALNTIYFQMDSSVKDAKNTVEKFAALLRYQLYDQQRTVPVKQEFEHLRNYISLQQTRANRILKVTVSFDEDVNDQHVYPLLFAPLVENAFKHVGGDYKIDISAGSYSGWLRFCVQNSLSSRPITHAGGIGMENLRRRLQLLYPGNHQLLIKQEADTFYAELKIARKDV